MKTAPAVGACLALFACSDAPPPPVSTQITNLWDTGIWQLFEIESIEQRGPEYTAPPVFLTLTGATLSHIDGVAFDPDPWRLLLGYLRPAPDGIFSREKRFLGSGPPWKDVRLWWRWRDGFIDYGENFDIGISIDSRSKVPQIVVVWRGLRNKLGYLMEDATTQATYRPALESPVRARVAKTLR